jgi:hypothetical protein
VIECVLSSGFETVLDDVDVEDEIDNKGERLLLRCDRGLLGPASGVGGRCRTFSLFTKSMLALSTSSYEQRKVSRKVCSF